MELRVQWENEADILEQIKMNMDKLGQTVRDAMREAACETRDFIAFRGAEDIQDAGNFGDRWVDAWKVEVTETQRTFRVTATMESSEEPVKYWPVFEYGATIHAKNPSGYMWLPFAGADGNDVWPRVYGSENLFRITSRKGLPMLLDRETREPMYFGKESVTIPKKFHLHEIAQEEAEKAGAVLDRILKEHLSEE